MSIQNKYVGMSDFRLYGLAGALISIVLLGGCNKKTADQDAVTGQVIAHVGSDDITAQELENEFRSANVPLDKRSETLTKRVLAEIVTRKYLVQQAIAAKLDREPTVHLDIMRSRERVLAGAFAQRTLSSKASSIGKSEVDQFIAAHSSQFAKREIFSTEQINMPIGAETHSIVDATKAFKTLDQVDQKLKELGISHERSTGSLDSANLPDEFASALQAKKDDDIFYVQNGSVGTFFKVTGEQSQPLAGDEATARARQMMQAEILKTAGEQAAQAAQASVKYEGEYAKMMKDQSSAKENSPAKN